MRVLHVGKYYPPIPGGVEYFLADLLGALHRNDIATAALVHKEKGRNASEGAHGDALPTIYYAPTLGRLLYAPVSPSFLYWLNRAIREFQPDLLHLHLPNTSAFAVLISPAAKRIPWILHWHADVADSRLDWRVGLAYRFYRPLEQRLLGRGKAVITTSPTYLAASKTLAPWHERCTVIPLGLDRKRLGPPSAALRDQACGRWGRSSLRVLAIGRLTYYKGHDVLINAVAELPSARLLIVGQGEHRGRLQALIGALRLEARAELRGFLPDDELMALLATCDVLCLPSLERTEAFGLVLLEAMRFAKPVVVSDIPGSGTGWVVAQARNGLLTRPGDPKSVAAALRQLQESPETRLALGERGRAALTSCFDIHPVADQIAALYARVLGR